MSLKEKQGFTEGPIVGKQQGLDSDPSLSYLRASPHYFPGNGQIA